MNLLKYIKFKKSFVAGFLLKTVEVVLELFLPIFMGIVMKEGLSNDSNANLNYNHAYLMVGMIILFASLGYLSTISAHKLTAKVSQDFAKNLRQAIFYQVQDLPIQDTNEFSSSSLVNRLNLDVSHLQNGLAMTMRIASRAPVLMVGSIIALYIVSPKIATVLIIGLPIVIIVLTVIMYFSMKIFQKFQTQNDKLIEIVKDNVEGVRMIRGFAQVEHEGNRFAERNSILSKIMAKLGVITSLSTPFTTLALNILLIIMIYFGASDINAGNMDPQNLIQVVNYTTQLTLSIISVMNLILLYTKTYSAAVRINEVLKKENSIKESATPVLLSLEPAKIEFRNVSFGYNDNTGKVLKNINFVINPGQTVGIVGLTGSGKTTIIDLIMRYFDINEGEILINDINIKDYDLNSLRNQIGYASQKASLLLGSVKSNILMSGNYNDEEIKKSLKESQASFIINRPDGIESTVERAGSNFSGGQRQRLALSRALVKDSSILILDDVFSALDYTTDLKIRKELSKRKIKQTKIYISQRLSSLANADNIIVIDEGTIIASGTHNELLQSNKLYKALYDTQVVGGDH